LITIDEMIIPAINGRAKHATRRNFAEPVENDSAINGRTNDANIAIDHTAAFVPMSFFFCADVMGGSPGSWCEVRVRMSLGQITTMLTEPPPTRSQKLETDRRGLRSNMYAQHGRDLIG